MGTIYELDEFVTHLKGPHPQMVIFYRNTENDMTSLQGEKTYYEQPQKASERRGNT